MEAVVEHLVRDHGRRKIAFLAGTPKNPEAKVRFDAYQAVLARHGIACDSALIARGQFRTNSAKVAMEEILARRRGVRRRRGGERRDGDRRHRCPAQARPAACPRTFR